MSELNQVRAAIQAMPYAHRKAIAYFLEVAYESLASNTCTDFDLKQIYSDDQQSAQALKDSAIEFEQEEDPDTKNTNFADFGDIDFQVVGYLSCLFDEALDGPAPQESIDPNDPVALIKAIRESSRRESLGY